MTKEIFQAYEDIRQSGEINMFNVSKVVELSNFELEKEDCLDIMKNYSKYKKEFGEK